MNFSDEEETTFLHNYVISCCASSPPKGVAKDNRRSYTWNFWNYSTEFSDLCKKNNCPKIISWKFIVPWHMINMMPELLCEKCGRHISKHSTLSLVCPVSRFDQKSPVLEPEKLSFSDSPKKLKRHKATHDLSKWTDLFYGEREIPQIA